MRTLGVLAAAVCFMTTGGGCEKKTRGKDSRTARDTTMALWALAPPGSPGGVVIGDGAPARAVDLAVALWNLVGERPFARPHLDEARAELRREVPFDLLDPAAWKGAGFDLSKGAALFAADDGREPALMVLPVGDRAAFVKTMKGTSETVNGRQIDRLDEVTCATAGGRYLCAKSLDAIDQAVKPHDSRLATAMKALPAQARGDVEAWVDMKKLPNDGDLPDEIWGTLRFGDDGAAVHLWMKGPQLAPAMMALGSGKVAAELEERTGRAGLVFRVQLNAAALAAAMPPPEPVGAIDPKKDLLDQLTGDLQLVVTSDAKLGAMLMVGLKDGGPPAKALQHACELGRAGLAADEVKGVTLAWSGGACAADVELAALGVAGVDRLRARAAVEGKLATISVGDVDLKSFAGNAAADAGSAEAKDLLGGAWPWTFWMRGFDFGAGLSPALLAQLGAASPEAQGGLDLASWLGAHLYEVAFGARFEDGALHVVGRVTTVGADPPEVRKAYGEALRKRFAGDAAGWKAGIDALAKGHPGSIAARMGSASAGTAFAVGTLSAIAIASMQSYVEKSRALAAPVEPAPR